MSHLLVSIYLYLLSKGSVGFRLDLFPSGSWNLTRFGSLFPLLPHAFRLSLFLLDTAITLGRKSWCYQVAESLNLLCYKETREDTRTPFPAETRQVVKEGKQKKINGDGGKIEER